MTALLRAPAGWPRILLGRAGASDPLDLDVAVAGGAFEGLRTAVRDLGPTGTTALVAAAGLRGRGGAGARTADKWRLAASTPATERYVVVNGYAADPAAATDRTLMELDPYSIVEGAALAALAIGAEEIVIAVRADAAEAIRRLEAAAAAATDAGYVGPEAHTSGRSVEISVRPLQGAYMLGEETVLLKALEGRRGQPEQQPPSPAERGLFGRPTVVHNPQTLAAVPWIVRHGAEAFAGTGLPDAPGTVLVHLRWPGGEGIVEVPLGTPLRELVGLAGPLPAGRSLKAVLVGGPAGGILPAEALDTPYEYAALRDAGAHIGSGSIVLADDGACIVDLARVLTRYAADQACGKTIPCRIGLRRLAEIGERIVEGRPRPQDLQLAEDLAHDVAASALCEHERLATLPLVSGMRYFRAELDEHIHNSACPAGICQPIGLAGASR